MWATWSSGSCARNLNLTIRTNSICTTQHLSWRITHKLLWDFDIPKKKKKKKRKYSITMIIMNMEFNIHTFCLNKYINDLIFALILQKWHESFGKIKNSSGLHTRSNLSMYFPRDFIELIEFNGISISLGLFYVFIVRPLLLKNFFAHGPIECELFLDSYIWPRDGSQSGTTTPNFQGR